MYEFIDLWLKESFGDGVLTSILSGLIEIILAAVIAAAFYIVLSVVNSIMLSRSRLDLIKTGADSIRKKKTIFKTSIFVFFAAFYEAIPVLSTIGSIVVLMIVVCDLLDVINDAYRTQKISRQRPIKGILSVVKVALCVLLGIILVSTLLNQNPIVLISGFGAFTAVLSIVFKDALVGLVAGIQITSENMFAIGDWISIPSLGVEGEVKDIALITVKIQGFDNIMHTVPTSTFQTTPFKNWHKTITDKMRQVNFQLAIDPDTIKTDGSETNLTKWRHHVLKIIKEDPHYKEGFATQCRTKGSSEGFGIPVDIFFTTDVVNYDDYCEYVSAFGSNVTASLKDFGLRSFKTSSPVQ